MLPLRDEEAIWLDASPFFRFCEAGALDALVRYLGRRARVVEDVWLELEFRATSPRPGERTHPQLQNLRRIGFPPVPPVRLEPRQVEEVLDLLAVLRQPGEHPRKHRGEIATVVVARDSGRQTVLVDDRDGRRLADRHRVPTRQTTDLAVEMVAEGALDAAVGSDVFVSVRHGLTGEGFRELVQTYCNGRSADGPFRVG